MAEQAKKGWLDDAGHRAWLWRGFIAAWLVLLLADIWVPKHGHFPWEDWPGFFAGYGIVSALVLVISARVLRRLVERPEDYYD